MDKSPILKRQYMRPSVALQIGLFLLPWSLRRRLLNFLFGYLIHPKAKIGFSVILAKRLDMNQNSRIGHATFVNGIDRFVLGEASKVGNFNWISGISSGSTKHFQDEIGRLPEFHMGVHASLTARHFVDCCNKVSIGDFSTVAGARSQILTHAIDLKENRQRSSPATIGRYCFVGTGSIILKGGNLPDFSVLAAGSTLHKAFFEKYTLYSGTPASGVRAMDETSKYFARNRGHVD